VNAADSSDDPQGRLIGTVVALGFGTVFVLANTDAVPDPWRAVLRVAAVVAALAVLLAAVATYRRVRRSRPEAGRSPRERWGTGYRKVVAGEVVALVAGLIVINAVLEAPPFAVAWVALVVGVHFVALARVWRVRLFGTLGAVMVVLAAAASVLGAASGSALPVQLVAGVGSGAALIVAAATAVDLRSPAR
jgi:hypothetical protein